MYGLCAARLDRLGIAFFSPEIGLGHANGVSLGGKCHKAPIARCSLGNSSTFFGWLQKELRFRARSPGRNRILNCRQFGATAEVINRLLDGLPQSFPFRGAMIGAVPKPVTKVAPLELDPVGPLNFGFKWGVDPVFDLTSIGPPVEFKVGGDVKARYVLKLIDKPGSLVPRLGLFVQGDFRGTIDWTSKAAESRPEIDLKGAFLGGIEGRF